MAIEGGLFTQMPHSKKIIWYAPTWSTAPKQWWALKKYIWSFGPLTRISLASTIVCGSILVALKIIFPAIVLPNLPSLILILPAFLGLFTLQTYALTKTRARVMITPKKIYVSHGQSATVIEPDTLTSVVLAIHDNEKARLRFCYQHRGKPRYKVVGVSEDLNLNDVEQLLPMEITPRDFRRREREITGR